jgi:hypothetical protein
MGRKRVTCVHKANIHKLADGLFLNTFREIADEYDEIEANDIIVDNACMQLVTKPEQFDVMVLPNLYGDIVSDLCAGLIGGLGVAPGSNIGKGVAIFEAVHGSAPDIAGRGVANPTALLQSAIHMLRHIGELEAAANIEVALTDTLAAGLKTRDLGGSLGTEEFTAAIIGRLRKVGGHRALTPVRVAEFSCHERATVKEKVIGVDVYIRSNFVPTPPASVGPLRFAGATNRGTEVTPTAEAYLTLVDWWRCRWTSTGEVSQQEVLDLLAALSPDWQWMHVEKLHTHNGLAGYAK